jgi:hypothetical protein
MIVYGDAEELTGAAAKRRSVLDAWRAVGCCAPGLARHTQLVTTFLELSEFVQGLADAAFDERGRDEVGGVADDGMALLTELARGIDRSWRSGFDVTEACPSEFEGRLLRLDHSTALRCRKAEGYAYYGLYPESYAEAAIHSGLGPHTFVIGIRSIGTGLAAMVAAALEAPLPVTLRPVGHPFRREIRVGAALADKILRGPTSAYAIVDEGPGLSGSSFGAIADWLEAGGVARSRIHFFPSHGGAPGPMAVPAHRERWSAVARHSVDLDALVLSAPRSEHRLESWASETIGERIRAVRDISAGEWRRLRYADERDWPPSHVQQERRKILFQTDSGPWLAKFVGLGRNGERALEQAGRLARAGFGPEVAGLRHGFLMSRWLDAAALNPADFGRSRLVERVAAYLAFRTNDLSEGRGDGASLDALFAMAASNAEEALGPAAADAVRNLAWNGRGLAGCIRRIRTDNRMHLWEWLSLPDGRLLKADAVDHHCAHDLVGCQDIAWDIAGAVVELALSEDEAEALIAAIDRAGTTVEPDLVDALTPCYLAFQIGAFTMASQSADAREAVRLKAAAFRYARLLGHRLGQASPAVSL